jgi:hypothetical protein
MGDCPGVTSAAFGMMAALGWIGVQLAGLMTWDSRNPERRPLLVQDHRRVVFEGLAKMSVNTLPAPCLSIKFAAWTY